MYNQTCSKYPKQVCVSLQYLQKNMGYEINFLPVDKHKNIVQIDSITLDVHGQACQKHPKQELYNICAISPGKCKGWSWFFPPDNCQTVLQIDTVIFDVCDQTCPNYPKQNVCYFSAISLERSEWRSWLSACRLAWKHNTNWYYDFDGDGQAFSKFPK